MSGNVFQISDTSGSFKFKQVSFDEPIVQMAIYQDPFVEDFREWNFRVYFLGNSGKLYSMESHSDIFEFTKSYSIEKVKLAEEVVDISSNSVTNHIILLLKSGKMITLGENESGQLGDGTFENSKSFVEVDLSKLSGLKDKKVAKLKQEQEKQEENKRQEEDEPRSYNITENNFLDTFSKGLGRVKWGDPIPKGCTGTPIAWKGSFDFAHEDIKNTFRIFESTSHVYYATSDSEGEGVRSIYIDMYDDGYAKEILKKVKETFNGNPQRLNIEIESRRSRFIIKLSPRT